jgi:hypothetical protein
MMTAGDNKKRPLIPRSGYTERRGGQSEVAVTGRLATVQRTLWTGGEHPSRLQRHHQTAIRAWQILNWVGRAFKGPKSKGTGTRSLTMTATGIARDADLAGFRSW